MEENRLPVIEDPKKDLSVVETSNGKDLLRRRRIAGVIVYAFSFLLAWDIMIGRHAPINTFLDVLAWICLLFAFSFLIWLIPMALVAKYMERSSKIEGPTSPIGK